MKSRILQVRKYLKLSQKEFGDSMGVSRDVIANYENGRVAPPKSFIKLLCSVHSVNPDWLETGMGDMIDKTGIKSDLDILFETLSTNDENGYKKRLVSVMARLKPSDWEVLERIAREMLQEESPKPTAETLAQELAELKADVAEMKKEEVETTPPVSVHSHSR